MLELTGRLGDGWLPSQSHVPPGEAARRGPIDDAASLRPVGDLVEVWALSANVEPSDDPRWAQWLADPAPTTARAPFIVTGDDPG